MRQYTLTKLPLQHLVIYFRRCYCRRCLRLIAGSAVYGCKYQASLITEKDVLQTKLGYDPLSCRAFLIFIVLSGYRHGALLAAFQHFHWQRQQQFYILRNIVDEILSEYVIISILLTSQIIILTYFLYIYCIKRTFSALTTYIYLSIKLRITF